MPVNMWWILVAFLSASSLFEGGLCLKLLELVVPSHAKLYSTVTLKCIFDTRRGSLYSVKWYKDDFEFFRFMPSDDRKITVFKVPGVVVDEASSGEDHVTLSDVVYRTSGTYKCEVSTGAPAFNTVLDSKNMTVLAWPERPPWITGIQERYSVTEYIFANCSSGKSNPGPRLVWHIDGRQPESWYVIESEMRQHDGPLYSREMSLQYPASKLTEGEVLINCSAWVGDMPQPFVSSVRVRIISEAANQQLSLERLRKNSATGNTALSLWLLGSIIVIFLAASS